MKRCGLISALLALTVLVGCSNQPYVVTDYLTDYDFSQLKTYSVADTQSNTKDNILISPFTFSHIHSLLERELDRRYQPVADDAKADFVVTYNIVIEEKIDPGTYDRMYGFGYYGRGYRYYPSPLFYGSTGSARVYNQGNLIIDIVDGKTDKPIWGGVSEKRLRSGLTPQQQREILSEAVVQVLSKFPPI